MLFSCLDHLGAIRRKSVPKPPFAPVFLAVGADHHPLNGARSPPSFGPCINTYRTHFPELTDPGCVLTWFRKSPCCSDPRSTYPTCRTQTTPSFRNLLQWFCKLVATSKHLPTTKPRARWPPSRPFWRATALFRLWPAPARLDRSARARSDAVSMHQQVSHHSATRPEPAAAVATENDRPRNLPTPQGGRSTRDGRGPSEANLL